MSKKDKAAPVDCICGKAAVVVKARGGKMVSCPDCENCEANLRTLWRSSLDEAVADWNVLVASARAKKDRERWSAGHRKP